MQLGKMRIVPTLVVRSLATAALWVSAATVWAQGYQGSPGNPFGGSTQRAQDVVFNNTIRRPTVSPYLNLLLPGGQTSTNYQTLVRPQLEQQRVNREQEIQLNRLQQQFTSALQSSTARPRGDQGIRPTGHTSTFFYLSHFYPQQQRPVR